MTSTGRSRSKSTTSITPDLRKSRPAGIGKLAISSGSRRTPVFQHFNSDPSNPAKLLCANNRLYKQLGYSRIEELENAPEYDAAHKSEPVAAGD